MNCEICNKTSGVTLNARDFITRDIFKYQHCFNCGTLTLIDVPLNFEKYYSKEYYSFKIVDNKNVIQRIKHIRDKYDFFQNNFFGFFFSKISSNANLKSLRNLQNFTKTSQLLDVGCGAGNDIRFLRKNGYENVYGIDPFVEKDVYFNEQILVSKQDIFSTNGCYDFIVLHHSFEHMNNPAKVFEKLFSLLKIDGTLMIRVPVCDSFVFEKYREYWVQLDAPRHIFLHTKKGLQILASENGFTIDKIIYDSCSLQFWGSDLALKNKSVHSLGKVEMLKERIGAFLKAYHIKAKKINEKQQGDQAIFLLKKIS